MLYNKPDKPSKLNIPNTLTTSMNQTQTQIGDGLTSKEKLMTVWGKFNVTPVLAECEICHNFDTCNHQNICWKHFAKVEWTFNKDYKIERIARKFNQRIEVLNNE